jgi:hypothetical protein
VESASWPSTGGTGGFRRVGADRVRAVDGFAREHSYAAAHVVRLDVDVDGLAIVIGRDDGFEHVERSRSAPKRLRELDGRPHRRTNLVRFDDHVDAEPCIEGRWLGTLDDAAIALKSEAVHVI